MIAPYGFDEYQKMFVYGNTTYPLLGSTTYPASPQEEITDSYVSMAGQAYRGNAVIFALIACRLAHFSEATFTFREIKDGRPGDLFDDAALAVLDEPEPGMTTGDLLSRAIMDVDLAGNWLATMVDGKLKRMRPDWTDILIGVPDGRDGTRNSLGATRVGYVYHPGGRHSGEEPDLLLADEVAHFMPYPDPLEPWKGMSWITPVVREVMSDNAARDHKLAFFERGATTNLAINIDPTRVRQTEFDQFVDKFRSKYEGVENAYKTLILRGAIDTTVIGSNFQQMDFKIVQGAGETRIAAAAGVPPIVVGLSEGLQAATYSNYDQARRRFADGTLRFLWRNISATLQTLVPPPRENAQLWYDDRDISFLRVDLTEEAEVLQGQSSAMSTLILAGFEPESVVSAVTANDLNRLKHTGMQTVQTRPGGGAIPPEGPQVLPPGETNGKGGQAAIPKKT
jgi:HK97 family phage portal protein